MRINRILGLVLAGLLWAAAVSAQSLTPAQLATLKASIVAASDGAVAVPGGACSAFVGTAINAIPNGSDGNTCVAAQYNLNAAVAFWVWRTAVSKDEYLGSTSVDATVFAWTGTGYITRSQGERDAFNALFNAEGLVNPSRANVRQAFTDIFSGATAPAPANRTHMSTVSRRLTTRGEKLYATGTGSTAVPGMLVVEGALSSDTIQVARNLP